MKTILGVVLAIGFLLPIVAMGQDTEAEVKAGKAVFDEWCISCHGEGRFMGGTNGLRAKYKDEKPAQLEQRTDLTRDTIRFFVRRGVGTMAPFRKTEITDKQLDSLAAYLTRKTSR